MDYTLSNAYATDAGTGNRMHQASSAVTTAVSDLDINQTIWSLMEIVKAAGLAGAQFDKTVPATYQKLLTALRSAGVFTTPAQFDNTTKAATTAFVKQSGTTLSNFYAYNASATLPNSNAGGLVEFYGATAGQTLTLPLAASARGADILTLVNYGSVPVTIARQGAEQINWGGGSGGISLLLQPGDSLVLAAGSGWFVIGGTAENQFSTGFGASKTANGYQKLPSGLIVQWGVSGTLSPSGSVTVTFPIAFPSGASVVTGTLQGNAYSYTHSAIFASIISATQVTFTEGSGGGVGGAGVMWIAIGA